LVEKVEYTDVWLKVKEAARTTAGKDGSGEYPSDRWKKTALLAEHSMIRKIHFKWVWIKLKSWISVHFVRHKIGIEHWVSTQRTDRTGIDRDKLPQDSPVNHEADANAQALITISRKRLCSQADPETRQAWSEVKDKMQTIDPVIASVMVRECVYRGFCPEFHCCGYVNTEAYQEELKKYREH
jgi:hypothetical protein